LHSDTTSAIEIPPPGPANLNPGLATLTIAGIGTAHVTSSIQAFTNFSEFGLSNPNLGTVIWVYGQPISSWELRAAFGPITFNSSFAELNVAPSRFTTDLGNLAMSSTGPWTFVATVPSPSAASLLALGGVVGTRRRRQRC
jgi:MYXO-CTERM domain-containing protein